MSAPIELLLAGASGAVGNEVLRMALVDARIARVVAPTRRPLASHRKLFNPVVDFNALPVNAPWWKVDAVICTLGTTIRKAGSEAAFAAIDCELPIRIGMLARQAGATRYALNSSLGASERGNFYLRTKARAEAGIRALDFPVFTIVRPSLIDAEREEARPLETMSIVALRILAPVVPRRYRVVEPEDIARALIDGVLRQKPGERIIESDAL